MIHDFCKNEREKFPDLARTHLYALKQLAKLVFTRGRFFAPRAGVARRNRASLELICPTSQDLF
jgi:hypothetical protein